MPAALVQECPRVSTSATTFTCIPPAGFTIGNRITVEVRGATAGRSTNLPTGGGVAAIDWTRDASNYVDGIWFVEVYSGPVTLASSNVVITTVGGTVTADVNCQEWSGIAASGFLDGTPATNHGTGGTVTGGGVIPTAGDSILIIESVSCQGATTGSDPVGYTPVASAGFPASRATSYKIDTSAAGTYTPGYTSPTNRWAAVTIIYKSGAGGGPPPATPNGGLWFLR